MVRFSSLHAPQPCSQYYYVSIVTDKSQTHRWHVLPQVPVEADVLPSGSPTLSSPEHELFEGWRAAREGLAAGSRPRLAETGSGGSYFLSNSAGVNVAGASLVESPQVGDRQSNREARSEPCAVFSQSCLPWH